MYIYTAEVISIENIANIIIPAQVVHPASGDVHTYTVTEGSLNSTLFSECTPLTSLNMEANLPLMGTALQGCTKLSTLIVTGNGDIGNELFVETPPVDAEIPNTTLQTVSITGGNKIKEKAFQYCQGITSLTLEDVTIGGTRSWCENLTSITLPSSVTSIGNGAFSNSNRLSSISILGSDVSLADSVFNGCDGLQTVYVTTEEMKVKVEEHFANATNKKNENKFKDYPTGVIVINMNGIIEETVEEQ